MKKTFALLSWKPGQLTRTATVILFGSPIARKNFPASHHYRTMVLDHKDRKDYEAAGFRVRRAVYDGKSFYISI